MQKKIQFYQPSPKQLIDYPLSDEGQRYWRKFRNVYKSVKFFQSPLTKIIQSPDDVSLKGVRSLSLRNIHNPRSLANKEADRDLKEAMYNLKKERQLFLLVENGNNIDTLQQLLDNDPKRYLYESSSPLRLANRKNQQGLTPLFIAARNGYLSVCQVLLRNGANPNQFVKLNDIDDSPLAVAIRWRHNDIVKELLKWQISREQLEMSLTYCDNQQKQILKSYLN